jgi:hypothetical protein
MRRRFPNEQEETEIRSTREQELDAVRNAINDLPANAKIPHGLQQRLRQAEQNLDAVNGANQIRIIK